ncbi:MAG: SIS domain-containing protein [Gammaproteobacteria bacterium]
MTTTTKTTDCLLIAKEVLSTEAQAILALTDRLDEQFTQAIDAMLQCKGRIIVTGMGKSGHIGNKIAATLASTGTPAFFVHPGEASHGDLGMITRLDVVIAISNSGETDEVLALLPMLKRFGITLIAMTGEPLSSLAQKADFHLNVGVDKEACPLGLAPTSSTTATLAMGDALAIVALEKRGFTAEDFALSHPGGALGKRLLISVADLMHPADQLPCVTESTMLSDALDEMTKKGFGITCIVDNDRKLIGVFTDGDVRRVLGKTLDKNATPISEVMTRGGRTIKKDQMAAEALQIMEQYKITSLFVVDDNQSPIGIIHMHDILRAGIA